MSRRDRQPSRPAPARGGRRTTLKAYLTQRSGFYTAEAVGLIAAKMAALALVGLCVWILIMMAEESIVGLLLAGPFILVAMILAMWVGLVLFTPRVLMVLLPANRFHRLPRPDGRARSARQAPPPAPAQLPALPDQALRSSPRGQANLFWRTGLFLLLGGPLLFLLGYCLLAYVDRLWLVWSSPIADWGWNAPEHFGSFGEWLFTEEFVTSKVLVTTFSFIFLTAGIALAVLAVPLLTRRGADAIDLAVTEVGVITRGGLMVGWDDIAEVLVVRDERITSSVGSRGIRAPGQPSFVLNPTYIAAHSRTRIALVLRDLPDVAGRCTGAQRRTLWAHRTSTYGYALCDLWVHSKDEVSTILASLQESARENRVPVNNLERTTARDVSDDELGWFGARFFLR